MRQVNWDRVPKEIWLAILSAILAVFLAVFGVVAWDPGLLLVAAAAILLLVVPALWQRLRHRPVAQLLPASRRSLAKALHRKFTSTRFFIEDEEGAFYRRIASVLVSAIAHRNASQVTVGIVGGPMILRTAKELSRRWTSEPYNPERVQFLAMNKSVDLGAPSLSADYLVTFLSQLFSNSRAIPYELDRATTPRHAVDILVCSVGKWHGNERESWLKLRLASAGLLHNTSLDDCVGDFCLQPVDLDGRKTGDDRVASFLATDIDPRPVFARLTDLASQKSEVILPISISTRPSTWREAGAERTLTGKEAVTKAVLRSGVVSKCILPKPLARNLRDSLGRHLLYSVSPRDDQKPLRLCRAHDLGDGSGDDPYVYDPRGRLDVLCSVDKALQARRESLGVIPDIVISEAYSELEGFDFGRRQGQVAFRLDGELFEFEVARHVRKPGQFSKLTLQLVCEEARHIKKRNAGKLALWDVGCGTGFLGLMLAKHFGDAIERIDLSDVSDDAVNCTHHNRAALGVPQGLVNAFHCHLLESKHTDAFDLVVFNAPFLPHGLPEKQGPDYGGKQGPELALEFARSVRERLKPGGAAVVTTTDYVDDGRIGEALRMSFGNQNVTFRNRLILYPTDTSDSGRPVDLAYEVKFRDKIEAICGYRFETCFIGHHQYVAFQARHYLARR
jgi:SAM-dependent methyltransferase